jgi:hypothetical protein
MRLGQREYHLISDFDVAKATKDLSGRKFVTRWSPKGECHIFSRQSRTLAGTILEVILQSVENGKD